MSAAELRRQDHERKLHRLASKQKAIEAQIAALQAEAESESESEVAEVSFAIAQQTLQEKTVQQNIKAMTYLRGNVKTGKRRTEGSQ